MLFKLLRNHSIILESLDILNVLNKVFIVRKRFEEGAEFFFNVTKNISSFDKPVECYLLQEFTRLHRLHQQGPHNYYHSIIQEKHHHYLLKLLRI